MIRNSSLGKQRHLVGKQRHLATLAAIALAAGAWGLFIDAVATGMPAAAAKARSGTPASKPTAGPQASSPAALPSIGEPGPASPDKPLPPPAPALQGAALKDLNVDTAQGVTPLSPGMVGGLPAWYKPPRP